MFDFLFSSDSSYEEPLPYSFKLPIDYLEESCVFDLSTVVAQDLELVCQEASVSTMYDIMLNPKTSFGKHTAQLWSKKYTTNIDFLNDSQCILHDFGSLKKIVQSHNYDNSVKYNSDIYEGLSSSLDIDKSNSNTEDELYLAYSRIKENKNFLAQYNYIEWDCFKHLNKNTSFLQCLSMLNVFSPAVSLIIPFLFLIFPFILLKATGEPITFENYIIALKNISRNHFIGKLISIVENQSLSNIAYVFLMCCFFFVQIYQNAISFEHYYNNMKQLNDDLVLIKSFVKSSIEKISQFLLISENKPTFMGFCDEAKSRLLTLQKIFHMLKDIRPFYVSISKLNELGELLQGYYELYDNPLYGDVLQYSFSFCGFIDNMCGIYGHLTDGVINYAKFHKESNSCETEVIPEKIDILSTVIREQFYPPYYKEAICVKNDCVLKKNMIITGVNASGKTTQLKTTMLNVIFTQQFGCGFYKSCILHPYTHIHSYLNIPDTSGRDSLFQAESRRCKEIIDIITDRDNNSNSRHLCIFDELYSGTNATEAKKAAFAFLTYLSRFSNVDFILTTHYTELCKKFIGHENITNYKMLVDRDNMGALKYKHKLMRGICRMKGGIDILRQMDYPEEILQMIL